LDSQTALYPDYPASSPYVLSVGATAILGSGNGIQLDSVPERAEPSLAPPCSTYNCTKVFTEVPCYLANAIFTSGGGFSAVEPMPAFQKAAVQHYFTSPGVQLPPSSKFNNTNRGYPDIGAIGQNVIIVVGGNYMVIGGTSSATPITAGIMTLLNNFLLNAGQAPLGFPNVLLYQMAATQPNTFNHITSGHNNCTEQACCEYGFMANPDGTWNPITGLGSPNVGNMIQYLQKNVLPFDDKEH